MSKKYDGWALKVGPYIRAFTVRNTREEVIKNFESLLKTSWRKYRRGGRHKIVRVRITEVEP